MKLVRLRQERLRSHRLSAPARSIAGAAEHLLATQAQEFWGGRWALAARTRGAPSVRDVDAQFDRGELVRSWTMRGTIHIVPARDLPWVLSVTRDRQLHHAANARRLLGIADDDLERAERIVRAVLAGGNRLTRAELFEVLDGGGVATAGQRGYHLLGALSMRLVLVQGPVVPREGAPTREQYVVLADEWIADAASPSDPLAELFVRFVAAHGPAGVRDFAWWTGLPLGTAREAERAASERLVAVEEGRYVAAERPRRSSAAPRVVALPPFEEYFISYADRSVVGPPEVVERVGPGRNGMVRPILLADGAIVGTWTHSVAVGRHTDDPVPALFDPAAASDAEVAAALDRYRWFITA
ncbi:winged helix DNA-binding domain-containing protein [Microbacterium sp.]|uniref:winged helix DNA-binding domain-containing protein n=1 Tax=Microbacterium sp. TaxID=51671 RepID=UPI0039E6B831